MNLKNYTSSVPVETTVARMEAKLAAAGASGIMKLYDAKGFITALVFKLDVGGKTYSVKVPAKAQSCFEAMWKDYVSTRTRYRDDYKPVIYQQALRTAWKIAQDWVEVQLSLIQLKQAEFLEVFMPYLWDGKQTYFESVKANHFKALPAPGETGAAAA